MGSSDQLYIQVKATSRRNSFLGSSPSFHIFIAFECVAVILHFVFWSACSLPLALKKGQTFIHSVKRGYDLIDQSVLELLSVFRRFFILVVVS